MTPEEFFNVAWPEAAPVTYRLYHDSRGFPLFYSMEHVPGTYIEITQQQYAANSMWVQVINGCLEPRAWQTVGKLIPSDSGISCHSQDVAIVCANGINWRVKNYEKN
jgi:hypothetical protein